MTKSEVELLASSASTILIRDGSRLYLVEAAFGIWLRRGKAVLHLLCLLCIIAPVALVTSNGLSWPSETLSLFLLIAAIGFFFTALKFRDMLHQKHKQVMAGDRNATHHYGCFDIKQGMFFAPDGTAVKFADLKIRRKYNAGFSFVRLVAEWNSGSRTLSPTHNTMPLMFWRIIRVLQQNGIGA